MSSHVPLPQHERPTVSTLPQWHRKAPQRALSKLRFYNSRALAEGPRISRALNIKRLCQHLQLRPQPKTRRMEPAHKFQRFRSWDLARKHFHWQKNNIKWVYSQYACGLMLLQAGMLEHTPLAGKDCAKSNIDEMTTPTLGVILRNLRSFSTNCRFAA